MNVDPTIQTYDNYADIYDSEVVEFWQRFPSLTIDRFVSFLSGTKVLNLGSGSGRDALLLRDAGLDVTCLDASNSMVSMTKQLGFPTIHTDFSHLDLDTYSFDGVWAYTSLIHVPPEELIATVTYLKKIIPENGIVLLGLIEGNGAKIVHRESMPGAERYFHFYQPDEIDNLMAGIDFELLFSEKYQPNKTLYLNRIYRIKTSD